MARRMTDMQHPRDALTIPQLILACAETYGDLPAFATRRRGAPWLPLSFRELADKGESLAAGLMSLGVHPGEPIGILSDNRMEWILAEAGIQLCGGISTPRGTDVTDEDLLHILDHAEVRICFLESPRELRRLRKLISRLPMLRTLILLTGDEADGESVLTLQALEARGRDTLKKHPLLVQARMERIGPNELFTLIYTSGTTGHPKGVMLTHANIMSQVRNTPLTLSCTDRVLSILPIWHVFERMFEMFALSQGVCTYYTSLRYLGQDLLNVEPTFMGSAPRLWESLHDKILQGVREAHPMRRLLFHTAFGIANLHHQSLRCLHGEDPEPPALPRPLQQLRKGILALRMALLLPFYGFFNASVLEAVRLKAGGCLKATISGGGALPAHIDHFFTTIGITVLEGYGLTETSPVLAVRVPGKRVPRTVGPVIPGTEVRIVSLENGEILYPDPQHPQGGRHCRGEIQVRGPQIMLGYRNQPELTAAVLSKEGWFRTGDIGMVTWNDCLRILGRCKSTIVLRNGENVEPEPLEARVLQCPLIDQVFVCGQDQKHLYALVVPNPEACRAAGFSEDGLEALAGSDALRLRILKEMKSLLSDTQLVSRHAKIQNIALLDTPFAVGDELTNLFKLKRHVIASKYADRLKRLFADDEPPAGKERT